VTPGNVVFVAGGTDTVLGRAIVRQLRDLNHDAVLAPTSDELPLHDVRAVEAFFAKTRPRYVFHAAGKSGGIEANRRHPATLMLDNLAAEASVLSVARAHRVEKLVYLASSCSYPRDARQPMQPQSLGTGPLEPTNEAYGTAKVAGIVLCEAIHDEDGLPFIAAIPANAFGPDDDFSEEESHVIGALIRRMHWARETGAPSVTIWGSGAPRREFLYCDDVASAAVFVMQHYSGRDPINLGGGVDLSIAELAAEIAGVVGYGGAIQFDRTRPDGMPRKALDSAPLFDLGWRPSIPFRDALVRTYEGFKQQIAVHA